MKRAVIVHGWDFNPSMHWYPWLREELEKRGYEVGIPEMPNTSEPKIEVWVAHLKKIIETIDENTLFIGHSIGCQTIMRYLESLPAQLKIKKVIFIAGWCKLENLEDEEVVRIAKPWLQTPINFEEIRQKIQNLTVFLSDNEPYGCVEENTNIFKEKLGAKVIILEKKGHFTQEDGVTQIPEILKEIPS